MEGLLAAKKKLISKPMQWKMPPKQPLMTRDVPIAGNNVLKRAISKRIGEKKKAEALA